MRDFFSRITYHASLIIPIRSIVAVGALGHRRRVILIVGGGVAGLAIGQAIMTKVYGAPVVGVMAVGTLAREVAARRRVAGLAIGEAAVVKVHIAPIVCVVAVGTLTAEVTGRWGMTGLAVRKATMVKGG